MMTNPIEYPLMKHLGSARGYQLGIAAEELVANLLNAAGYVVRPLPKEAHRGDLQAIDPHTGNLINVEVKASRRGSNGWAFCMKKSDRHGVTNVHHADVVVLVAVGKSGYVLETLVIPTEEITAKYVNFRTFEALTNGRYAAWRQFPNEINLTIEDYQ